MSDILIDAAKKVGAQHGSTSAGWAVTSNNCTVDAATRIVKGHEDGDPKVMDLCPNPLSGEWADDPTPMALLDEIANQVTDPHRLRGQDIEDTEDVLDAYEEAFRDKFWTEVLNTCKEIIKP